VTAQLRADLNGCIDKKESLEDHAGRPSPLASVEFASTGGAKRGKKKDKNKKAAGGGAASAPQLSDADDVTGP